MSMTRALRNSITCRQLPVVGVCLLVLSCSKQYAPEPVSESEQNLSKIGRAYMLAMGGLKRAPQNAAELTPYLKELGESSSCLRSPEDGEEYVIIWKIKPDEMAPRGSGPDRQFPVLAYEKKGSGGKRYVLMVPNRIQLLSEDELRNAYFPGGHKPKL
jgi:hypothetical protein